MVRFYEIAAFDKYFAEMGAVEYGDVKIPQGNVGTEWMFRHYFNAQGTEIGYITIPLCGAEWYRPQIFGTPRSWYAPYKMNLYLGSLADSIKKCDEFVNTKPWRPTC